MYGKMIADLRKARGMRQVELGERLGIGVSSVSLWEAEKREPSLDHLMAIAELFDVSVDYILYGEKDERKLSKDETELVEMYSKLSADRRIAVKGIVQGLILAEKGE